MYERLQNEIWMGDQNFSAQFHEADKLVSSVLFNLKDRNDQTQLKRQGQVEQKGDLDWVGLDQD